MYHAEDAQEGFFVLEGECLLIVEGEERRLKQWDYFHCPNGTEHITVGAGDGPCAILMLGCADPGPVDPLPGERARRAPWGVGGTGDRFAARGVRGSAEARARARAVAELRSCAADVAALRAEPDDAAEQVTQAVLGEPLWVEEERDGWARVRTLYDYPGWIRLDQLRGDPLEQARQFVGVPYEWGGLTERGIDCSGLVHVAYRRAAGSCRATRTSRRTRGWRWTRRPPARRSRDLRPSGRSCRPHRVLAGGGANPARDGARRRGRGGGGARAGGARAAPAEGCSGSDPSTEVGRGAKAAVFGGR